MSETTEAPLTIRQIIADLADLGKPLSSSIPVHLSNLTSAEMTLLEQGWGQIEHHRRCLILERLAELAEENVEFSFDSIFKYCLADEDAAVRVKAIEGLGECEEPSLISPLINLLERDSSYEVQAAAATALGKFALLAELDKLRASHAIRVRQTLLAVLNDKGRPAEVRCRALEAAAPLSIPEVTVAISEAYNSGDLVLKTSAIYAMGKNCALSWLPFLLKELSSAHAEIRYEAAGACGEIGDELAVPLLVKLVHDPDVQVQLVAVQALGKIGGKEAKERLNRCLSHTSRAIREAAESALSELAALEDPLSFKGMV